MMIIKIAPNANGSHTNQSWFGQVPPEGYAIVPDNLEIPHFPFGKVVVEDIAGVPTVTQWTALPIPDAEPVKQEPSTLDKILAQVTYTALKTNTLIGGGR